MKISVVISLVCLVLLFLLVQQNRKLNALKNHFAIVNDSLTVVKDKHNREVATAKILQLEKKDLKKMAELYKSKFELEKIKPGKVVYISNTKTQTQHDTTIKTIVAYKDSLPIYTISDSSDWHTLNITAAADSSFISFSVSNQYITTHTKTTPFWKSPEYEITTINLNPHTTTKEQSTHKLKPKKANRLIWLVVGGLITFIIK